MMNEICLSRAIKSVNSYLDADEESVFKHSNRSHRSISLHSQNKVILCPEGLRCVEKVDENSTERLNFLRNTKKLSY
jgi:hypothetical protein